MLLLGDWHPCLSCNSRWSHWPARRQALGLLWLPQTYGSSRKFDYGFQLFHAAKYHHGPYSHFDYVYSLDYVFSIDYIKSLEYVYSHDSDFAIDWGASLDYGVFLGSLDSLDCFYPLDCKLELAYSYSRDSYGYGH